MTSATIQPVTSAKSRLAASLVTALTLVVGACSSTLPGGQAGDTSAATISTDSSTDSPDSGQPDSGQPVITELEPVGSESSSSAAPESATTGELDSGGGVQPEGFTTAIVEITEADGTVCEVCVWLADTSGERGRGLMDVTDLGRAEAMAFVWDRPTSGAFYMFQTVTPLSIAWFAEPTVDGAGGALVSTADMDPCTSTDPSECERFPAGGPFVLALEVFQGDLASIGITDGATARLVPGSEAADCPAG